MSAAPLPLSRPFSTLGGTNGRWTVSRWPLNSNGPSGPAAVETDEDRGRGGMAPLRPFDLKALGRENLRQSIAGRPASRWAMHLDEPDGGLDEPVAVDQISQLVKVQPGGFHERHDIPHTMASRCSGADPRRRRRGRLPGDGAFDLVVAA